MIINKMNDRLKFAMKESNKDEILAIRNILGKIKKYQIDNKQELDDNGIINIMNKYAKQVRESIKQFKSGNRLDLAEKEKDELNIIEQFLPKQKTQEEIKRIVKDVIESMNVTGMQDMGLVMKKVMDITRGSADGKLISEEVRSILK